VASGGESACPLRCFVHRTHIVFISNFVVLFRFEENHGNKSPFLARSSIYQSESVEINLTAFHVKAVEEDAVSCIPIYFFLVEEGLQLELEVKLINCNGILSCIVLKQCGEEALREEEGWQPECAGLPFHQPSPQEFHSLGQVLDPRGKGLQRRVGVLVPDLRHLVVQHALVHLLHIFTHHSQPLYRILQSVQTLPYHLNQLVESFHFL